MRDIYVRDIWGDTVVSTVGVAVRAPVRARNREPEEVLDAAGAGRRALGRGGGRPRDNARRKSRFPAWVFGMLRYIYTAVHV
jgi:hypothetical protein